MYQIQRVLNIKMDAGANYTETGLIITYFNALVPTVEVSVVTFVIRLEIA
jgi:hypothetical protein